MLARCMVDGSGWGHDPFPHGRGSKNWSPKPWCVDHVLSGWSTNGARWSTHSHATSPGRLAHRPTCSGAGTRDHGGPETLQAVRCSGEAGGLVLAEHIATCEMCLLGRICRNIPGPSCGVQRTSLSSEPLDTQTGWSCLFSIEVNVLTLRASKHFVTVIDGRSTGTWTSMVFPWHSGQMEANHR